MLLAVTDTGTGMSQEIADQIFDPFFTTKIVGRGVGLGLSMVQGFVKQSGGAVRVYSEPGEGTSVKLYFPVDTNASREKPSADSGPHPVAVDLTGKRILLVEDQKEVIIIFQKTLVGAGFEVVTAESGDEAFEKFARDSEFNLVITDIVMPGLLQGPSLAKKIRVLQPNMRFIFLSGYASEATVHGNGLNVEDIRLMKPISRANLTKAVVKSLLITDEELN